MSALRRSASAAQTNKSRPQKPPRNARICCPFRFVLTGASLPCVALVSGSSNPDTLLSAVLPGVFPAVLPALPRFCAAFRSAEHPDPLQDCWRCFHRNPVQGGAGAARTREGRQEDRQLGKQSHPCRRVRRQDATRKAFILRSLDGNPWLRVVAVAGNTPPGMGEVESSVSLLQHQLPTRVC